MLYLDIETGPLPIEERRFCCPQVEDIKFGNLKDPEKVKAKILETVKDWEENGNALDPIESQVLAIGQADRDGAFQMLTGDESHILTVFWNMLKDRPLIVGHYIAAFDLPFMIKRSMLLGVDFPDYVIQELHSYAPDEELIFDTRLAWCGNKNEHISLKKLAAACGYACKTGEVTGADWWKYWRDGKSDECYQYLKDDVLAVKAIYERLFS